MDNITNKPVYKKHLFRLAWKLSFPVLLSYFSLSMVFGILFNQLHEPWYYAPIMSLLAYSGTVQFVAIGIMAGHGSYLLILLSTFFIAARNSFYGLSFLTRFQAKGWRKAYFIFALVDANYAIMVANPPYEDEKQDRKFCLYLAALVQSYWVVGSLVGAFFSTKLMQLKDLEFVLIAFFAVLVFEQYLKAKSLAPIFTAIITAGIALIFVPLKMMLVTAILLSCVVLLVVYFKEKHANDA